MKKIKGNLPLVVLAFFFVLAFKHNSIVKLSVINSIKMWFYNLVPFMFVMYTFVDLSINYGLTNLMKNNKLVLFILSMLLGTPSNAKYINEFYQEKNITYEEANSLLYYSYSPNPLFILGVAPNKGMGLIIILYLYMMNLFLAKVYKVPKTSKIKRKWYKKESFSACLEKSIKKSTNVLVLILGIIIIFGLVNTFLDVIIPGKSFIIKLFLELTNSVILIKETNYKVLLLLMLICSFGGISIHIQVKTILENSKLKYRNFLKGRIISTLPIVIILALSLLYDLIF